MLRRGDDHRVDGGIFEETAGIRISSGVWCEVQSFFEPAGIDVGEGYEFSVWAGGGFTGELSAAVADADDADADAVTGAEDTTRGKWVPARLVATFPMKFLRVCMSRWY